MSKGRPSPFLSRSGISFNKALTIDFRSIEFSFFADFKILSTVSAADASIIDHQVNIDYTSWIEID
jgi:hypothetical protein